MNLVLFLYREIQNSIIYSTKISSFSISHSQVSHAALLHYRCKSILVLTINIKNITPEYVLTTWLILRLILKIHCEYINTTNKTYQFLYT